MKLNNEYKVYYKEKLSKDSFIGKLIGIFAKDTEIIYQFSVGSKLEFVTQRNIIKTDECIN